MMWGLTRLNKIQGFVHVKKEKFHVYTFFSQVAKPIFKSIPEHSEH